LVYFVIYLVLYYELFSNQATVKVNFQPQTASYLWIGYWRKCLYLLLFHPLFRLNIDLIHALSLSLW